MRRRLELRMRSLKPKRRLALPVKVLNGAETWAGELAMVFDRSSDAKPYDVVTAVRFYPPSGESGFCAYYPDGSSPK